MGAYSFSHTEEEGAKGFHPYKGGHERFYPVLREAGKVSDLRFSHFAPPSPPHN